MSLSLNRKWFHKLIDMTMPGNCRRKLEKAFRQNTTACANFLHYIHQHEHEVVAALKEDRRAKERRS